MIKERRNIRREKKHKVQNLFLILSLFVRKRNKKQKGTNNSFWRETLWLQQIIDHLRNKTLPVDQHEKTISFLSCPLTRNDSIFVKGEEGGFKMHFKSLARILDKSEILLNILMNKLCLVSKKENSFFHDPKSLNPCLVSSLVSSCSCSWEEEGGWREREDEEKERMERKRGIKKGNQDYEW